MKKSLLFLILGIFIVSSANFTDADEQTIFVSGGDSETITNVQFLPNQTVQDNISSPGAPAEEGDTESDVGSGGGGTGAVIVPIGKATFSLEPEIINILIKKGDTFKSSIKIKNTAGTPQNFVLEPSDSIKIFTILPETKFSLNPDEEKEITLIFATTNDTKEDTYTGNLKILTSQSQVEVPVIMGVKSKLILFDVTLNIPAKYKNLIPGDDLLFQVSLFNLGEVGKVDVEIEYSLKDLYGNTMVKDNAVVAVETQASFSRSIKLPEDIAEGQYVVVANVRYGSSLGTSSDMFSVNKERLGGTNYLIAVILGILGLVISTFFIISHFNRKIRQISRVYVKELNIVEKRIKAGKVKSSDVLEMSQKLNSQRSLLEKAYHSGYITKNSYRKGKEKIDKVHKKLKRRYL